VTENNEGLDRLRSIYEQLCEMGVKVDQKLLCKYIKIVVDVKD